MVAPVGGETGQVLRCLLPDWGIELTPISIEADSPSYIHDRRSGERKVIAQTHPGELNRHELDELYDRTLEKAIEAAVFVVTGRAVGDPLPLEVYRRLGADLASAGVQVAGDLHGEELESFLEGGPIELLKVSDDDLRSDGRLTGNANTAQRMKAIRTIQDRGVKSLVLSASKAATIARFGSRAFKVASLRLESVDHRGSGDSMTAGLAMGMTRNYDAKEMLSIACAAGAANVTRHGLGNASGELVEQLMTRIEVTELDKKEGGK